MKFLAVTTLVGIIFSISVVQASAQTTVTLGGGVYPDRLVCRGPLSSYGSLPIRFVSNITNTRARQLHNGILRFETGCRGDGNSNTIDAIINLNGNGRDRGSDDDALVVAGARDIQMTGYAECGWLAPGSHQDAFRFNRGGPNIDLINFRSGNWNTLTATCHGAGANVYMDNVFQSAAGSVDAVCVRCSVVGTKSYDPNAGPAGKGLGIGWSTNSGARNSRFAGNVPIVVYGNTFHPGFINLSNCTVDLNDSIPNNPAACPLP